MAVDAAGVDRRWSGWFRVLAGVDRNNSRRPLSGFSIPA
jgi:hypothetical protein